MSENKRNIINENDDGIFSDCAGEKENGFSLVEVVIALTILLISVLSVFAVFTYATVYNAGNSRRSQALSVLQREVELIRSAKFTPTITDNYSPTTPDDGRRDLTGGTKATRTVTAIDGASYTVETTVDDDPSNPGVDVDSCDPSCKKTLKEITLVVKPVSRNGSWVVDFPAKVVFRRVRAN